MTLSFQVGAEAAVQQTRDLRNYLWCQIYRKNVIRIQIWFNFLVCTMIIFENIDVSRRAPKPRRSRRGSAWLPARTSSA